MATVIAAANEETKNGNIVRRSDTKHNKKILTTNDESKESGRSTTLNWYAKTAVIQDTQRVTATKNKKKHQQSADSPTRNKTLKITNNSEKILGKPTKQSTSVKPPNSPII